jgi:hypothetical protein
MKSYNIRLHINRGCGNNNNLFGNLSLSIAVLEIVLKVVLKQISD